MNLSPEGVPSRSNQKLIPLEYQKTLEERIGLKVVVDQENSKMGWNLAE